MQVQTEEIEFDKILGGHIKIQQKHLVLWSDW